MAKYQPALESSSSSEPNKTLEDSLLLCYQLGTVPIQYKPVQQEQEEALKFEFKIGNIVEKSIEHSYSPEIENMLTNPNNFDFSNKPVVAGGKDQKDMGAGKAAEGKIEVEKQVEVEEKEAQYKPVQQKQDETLKFEFKIGNIIETSSQNLYLPEIENMLANPKIFDFSNKSVGDVDMKNGEDGLKFCEAHELEFLNLWMREIKFSQRNCKGVLKHQAKFLIDEESKVRPEVAQTCFDTLLRKVLSLVDGDKETTTMKIFIRSRYLRYGRECFVNKTYLQMSGRTVYKELKKLQAQNSDFRIDSNFTIQVDVRKKTKCELFI